MRLHRAFLLALALVTAPAAFSQASGPHFNVSAAFVPPAGKGADGAVAVTFVALDPDVRMNEEPGPRLKLDATQTILVDKQRPAPAKAEAFDPDKAKYLDLSAPVLFAVGISPEAPKGSQTAKANVTYFYCSKREGWCRKGTADVAVSLDVP